MVKVSLEIMKRDFVWIGLLVVLVGIGFGYAIGSGDYQVMGHTVDELNLSGVCLSDGTNCPSSPERLSWSSEWIAVSKRVAYTNGGNDAAGNVIDLNHNLGTADIVTQIFYAPDSGTFPSSPNTSVASAIVGHSDSNVDWRSVHSGVLLQEFGANEIGKIVTGHESVGIWDDGDNSWSDFRKDKGWIKIVLIA